MKKYKLELKEKDFEQMANELKTISQKLYKAEDLILNALAEYTKEQIKFYIEESTGWYDYIPTGELLNSITTSDIFNHTIRVYTDSAYAAYVEYGTGIRGSYTPHPEPIGDYDMSHLGQHAHRFMYDAFQDLKNNYMEIAKDVLRKEGII